jgi:phage baseplate assembly protein W
MALGPKLPLHIDDIYGAYGLIDNYKDLIAQNLKMIVLTAPGERMMDPLFGVGIRNFHFENFDAGTTSEIKSRISSQIRAYMPFVKLQTVNISFSDTSYILSVSIKYKVPSINLDAVLSIESNITR